MRTRILLENSKKELLKLLEKAAFGSFEKYEGNEIGRMPSRQEITRKGGSVVVLYR